MDYKDWQKLDEKYEYTIDTLMMLLDVIAKIREHCEQIIESNEQWAKDNNVDVEMDDVRTGENAMAKDILSFIETNEEWEKKYG